jgi:DNA-binding NtrC family response regulator
MAGVVGESEVLMELYRVVDNVADTDQPVLITGECGVGKQLVAEALHRASHRAGQPFVSLNCGSLSEDLLDSDLFGDAQASFGAGQQSRVGRIAQAQGSTLFLDEIGELPPALQAKLLRFLETGRFCPVGGSRAFEADVRIVTATNINLEARVASGSFRADLFRRLNVIRLVVPPLRGRVRDIPLLVYHALSHARKKTGRDNVRYVSRAAAEILCNYSWPGNVRELEDTIEHAALLCGGDTIEPRDLPARVCGLGTERRASPQLPDSGLDLRYAVESLENALIRQALERTHWNKNRAAKLLGLNRTTLVEMLKRKRIAPPAA